VKIEKELEANPVLGGGREREGKMEYSSKNLRSERKGHAPNTSLKTSGGVHKSSQLKAGGK